MKTSNRFRSALSGMLLACFLSAAVCVLFVLVPPRGAERMVWNGYYVVLVDRAVPADEVSRALADAGFRNVISADRTEVTFCTFDGLERVALGALEDRLDPRDPRLDPYMTTVGRYFETGDTGRRETVYYVPSREPSVLFALRLFGALRGTADGRFRVAGWNVPANILAAALFAGIAAAAAAAGSRGGRAPLVLGAVPWLVLLVFGGSARFSSAALVYIAWAWWHRAAEAYAAERLRRPERPPAVNRVATGTAVVAAAFVLAAVTELLPYRGASGAAAVFVGLCANLALTAGMVFLAAVRRERSEHRYFLPVTILGGTRFGRTGVRTVSRTARTAAAVLLAAPVVIGLAGIGSAAVVPVMQNPGPEGFTWETLEPLSAAGPKKPLPDLSDYVAHRAYQDGYPYARGYRFPETGEEVTVHEYERAEDGTTILERLRTVLRFDEAWLESVLADVPSDGVERLLLSQGRAGTVTYERVPAGPVETVRLVKELLLCAAAGVMLIFSVKNLTSVSLYDMRNTPPRRERQTV